MRGFGILPSRAMKTKRRDYSDWGEGKMRGALQHLFRQREKLFVRLVVFMLILLRQATTLSPDIFNQI